ncbi:MAG TPA: hypothetical protein VGJ50_20155 [Streptosporangiaceae bacterium]|jgi:hypothetical protein
MTSTRRPGPEGLGRARSAMQRAVRTLRYVNQELLRANEAIFRPVGPPRRRESPASQAGAPAAAQPPAAATTGHDRQAA